MTEAQGTNGRKIAQELFGLFLIFWGLLVLLSLASYDQGDPGINHAVSAAAGVKNSAGLFGAYLSGLLVDIFGVAALIWPAVFIAWGAGCISTWFTMPWWRWCGFILLTICLISVGAAWNFGMGDVRGGGMLGMSLYQKATAMFNPVGSLLVWLFLLFLSLELAFGIAWLALIGAGARFLRRRLETCPAFRNGMEGRLAPLEWLARLPSRNNGAPCDETRQDREAAPEVSPQSPREVPQNAFDEACASADADEIIPLCEVHVDAPASVQLSPPPASVNNPQERPAAGQEEPFVPLRMGPPEEEQALPRSGKESPSVPSLARSLARTISDAVAETAARLAPERAGNAPVPSATLRMADFEDAPSAPAAPVAPAPQHARAADRADDWTNSTVAPSRPHEADRTDDSDGACAMSATLMPPSPDSDGEDWKFAPTPPAAASRPLPERPLEVSAGHMAERAASPAIDPVAVPAAPQPETQPFHQTSQAPTPPLVIPPALTPPILPSPAPAPSTPEIPAPTPSVWMTTPAPQAPTLAPSAPAAPLAAQAPQVAETATPGRRFPAMPSLDLLRPPQQSDALPDPDVLDQKSRELMNCLADFNVQGELIRVTPGPVITLFEIRPAPGVRVGRITNLNDDLARSLRAEAVRIQAPVPGSDTVGIEIPNAVRATVNFRELVQSPAFQESDSRLTMALGKDIEGRPAVRDLATMPHALVAGTTGSGKSVCLNSILVSLLYKATPDEVKLMLIDPKRVEMAMYRDMPHLVHPVVTEMSLAKTALDWAVHEMERRYDCLARLGVKNIRDFNKKIIQMGENRPPALADLAYLPYLVIVIDELADLMMTAGKEVEACLVRLAQLARAAGIHLIVATQRPSVDVVTGILRANFPCRIAFQVANKYDSRTILDASGAEKLLGKGDMLFKPSGGKLQRLHGPFVTDEEVEAVVEHWKRQLPPKYEVDFSEWGMAAAEAKTTAGGSSGGAGGASSEEEALYAEAVAFVQEQGRMSISLLQRRFRIGFNKAARFVERMEQEGILPPASRANKARQVRADS